MKNRGASIPKLDPFLPSFQNQDWAYGDKPAFSFAVTTFWEITSLGNYFFGKTTLISFNILASVFFPLAFI